MSKKKGETAAEQKADRHTVKSFTFRFDPVIRRQMELLVEQNRSDLSEEIRKSMIETLKNEKLWPPIDEH